MNNEQTPTTADRITNSPIPFSVASPLATETIGGEICVGVRRLNGTPVGNPVPVGPGTAFVPVLAGAPYLPEGIEIPAPVHIAPAGPTAVTLPCISGNVDPRALSDEDIAAEFIVLAAALAAVLVGLPVSRAWRAGMFQGRAGMQAPVPGIPSGVISLMMLSAVETRLLWARAICWLSMSYTT